MTRQTSPCRPEEIPGFAGHAVVSAVIIERCLEAQSGLTTACPVVACEFGEPEQLDLTYYNLTERCRSWRHQFPEEGASPLFEKLAEAMDGQFLCYLAASHWGYLGSVRQPA